MRTTRAVGFRLRASDGWMYCQPEQVVAVRDVPSTTNYEYTEIITSDGTRWEVKGRAEGIAAIIWPLGEATIDDE